MLPLLRKDNDNPYGFISIINANKSNFLRKLVNERAGPNPPTEESGTGAGRCYAAHIFLGGNWN